MANGLKLAHYRKPPPHGQIDDPRAVTDDKQIVHGDERFGARLGGGLEGFFKIDGIGHRQRL